jgi:hypothetical protein
MVTITMSAKDGLFFQLREVNSTCINQTNIRKELIYV